MTVQIVKAVDRLLLDYLINRYYHQNIEIKKYNPCN